MTLMFPFLFISIHIDILATHIDIIDIVSLFLYTFISFTFQGWIRYQSFCSGRILGALVKTMKYLKFRIILVIPVRNLALPLTFPSFLPYFTSYFTLPYFTIPYCNLILCLTLPYFMSYLTLHPILPYLTLSLTLPYILPYLTIPHVLRYLTSYFTLPYLMS